MSPSLPPGDSRELHLVVATPEEILAQQNANSDEWRGVLPLPAYLRREEILAEQDLTKDGGLTSWALVYQPSGSSEQDRQVVCGCETIRKRALVASNNTVEFVTAHSVCSVFCPPQFRGKGYAGRMMVELGERLKTWQSKGQSNLFSVLWSDIGKVCKCCEIAAICRPSCHISIRQPTPHFSQSPTHHNTGLLRRPRLACFPILPHLSHRKPRHPLRPPSHPTPNNSRPPLPMRSRRIRPPLPNPQSTNPHRSPRPRPRHPNLAPRSRRLRRF